MVTGFLSYRIAGSNEVEDCGVSEKEAGLLWDIICFVALLIQRRIFMSTYFQIVACEEKAQAALSSRYCATH